MKNVFRLPVERNGLANLVNEIKSVIYKQTGNISIAEAVGVLELAKIELVNEQMKD